jgi:hypothetical protein
MLMSMNSDKWHLADRSCLAAKVSESGGIDSDLGKEHAFRLASNWPAESALDSEASIQA